MVACSTVLTVVVLAFVLISGLAADFNVSFCVVVSLDVAVDESLGVQSRWLRYKKNSRPARHGDDCLVVELGTRVGSS